MKFYILSILAPLLLIAGQQLEQKVGGLLMTHIRGQEANEEAQRLIQEGCVGGIIYFEWANGLDSPEQVGRLSKQLQALSPDNPLIIAIDQEGGRVNRLKNGFSQPPANGWIGLHGSPSLAEKWAVQVGEELKAVGINMNLAPVVDVNSNHENPIIGDRSYGSDSWDVVRNGQAALKGYRIAQVASVLKHFPGHGDRVGDSHIGLPVISKSRDELEKMELIPFRRLLPEAPAVMMAHILVPSLDPEKPASFSKKIIREFLREEIGFQGVVMTDSLVMRGALEKFDSIDQAAIEALHAGNDLLILGGKVDYEGSTIECTAEDVIRIRQNICKAVREGILSEESIDQSLARINKLKRLCTH